MVLSNIPTVLARRKMTWGDGAELCTLAHCWIYGSSSSRRLPLMELLKAMMVLYTVPCCVLHRKSSRENSTVCLMNNSIHFHLRKSLSRSIHFWLTMIPLKNCWLSSHRNSYNRMQVCLLCERLRVISSSEISHIVYLFKRSRFKASSHRIYSLCRPMPSSLAD